MPRLPMPPGGVTATCLPVATASMASRIFT